MEEARFYAPEIRVVNVVFEGSSQCLKEPKRSGAKMVNHRTGIVEPEGPRHPVARTGLDREKGSFAQGANRFL
ncbi:MAG: hypothetical protein WDN76_09740 [Alphaproteobacteria bacterium]